MLSLRRALIALSLLLSSAIGSAWIGDLPGEGSASAQRVRRTSKASTRPARAQKTVVFVGLPGSGKSFAAKRLASKLRAAAPLSSGDVIREAIANSPVQGAASERSLEVSREFARKKGEVGRRVADKLEHRDDDLVIVEGFRTEADLAAFRDRYPNTTVVAMDVPTALRHERMLARGRSGEDNRAYLRSARPPGACARRRRDRGESRRQAPGPHQRSPRSRSRARCPRSPFDRRATVNRRTSAPALALFPRRGGHGGRSRARGAPRSSPGERPARAPQPRRRRELSALPRGGCAAAPPRARRGRRARAR